jgi:hypothetical protein
MFGAYGQDFDQNGCIGIYYAVYHTFCLVQQKTIENNNALYCALYCTYRLIPSWGGYSRVGLIQIFFVVNIVTCVLLLICAVIVQTRYNNKVLCTYIILTSPFQTLTMKTTLFPRFLTRTMITSSTFLIAGT